MIYRFHPVAETEHFQTIQFYESRSAGLGGDYLQEFEQVMEHVVEAPHRYRIERKPNIRRASLTRFPYKVIYRELEGYVQVLAISHKRRRPAYWAGRL
ncbi:MAG: type II toxin-antitoxin system RelE/ParE family toxin [Panacagrimonas sp.]